MNIKQAKEQIKNAMVAYFSKDEYGNYAIPIEKQRPIFMMGPPGIGKTAIMEQVASELNVGLVSYSMTHHTRQSALGLPFIETKVYGGKEYSVSEYTMSEIIASVYDMIEETGHREGILFLDEINCVSETLAPAMLQFLQYKIFGRHTVPNGWIVVTAGNPPEYNDSVREFDVVTWDRLKRVDVEPNYDVWKEYASYKGIHPSITTYLDVKKDDFYKIETTVDGKSFVTARGWSDLSDMIYLYEKNDILVDATLVSQYLQNKKIAKEFAIYYDLFNKYKSDYQVDDILKGKAPTSIVDRAKNAKFDERLALLGLVLDAIVFDARELSKQENVIREYMQDIKSAKEKLVANNDIEEILDVLIKNREKMIENGKKASSISSEKIAIYYGTIKLLETVKEQLKLQHFTDSNGIFNQLKTDFNTQVENMKKNSVDIGKHLSNAFKFFEKAFGDSQEMLIFVTELTANYYTANFISRYGCKEYFEHNKELLFYERQKEIIEEIELLQLD